VKFLLTIVLQQSEVRSHTGDASDDVQGILVT